jgi:S1-C subfamily serine protease
VKKFGLVVCLACSSLGLCFPSALGLSEKSNNSTKGQAPEKKQEIDQKQLFNVIRRGVVAVRVTAHMIMEKIFNEKMWWGTGFIVDLKNGLILTNSHVVGDMAVCTYEVKFGDGTKAQAKIEYIDPCYDFAILSVTPKDLPKDSIALELSEAPLSVNVPVFSMGNSDGNEFSTYPGTIFDVYSVLWLKEFAEQSLQFSGLTVPGASGSPVFVAEGPEMGKVIGLLYGGKMVSGAALPISYAKLVIDKLKKGTIFKRYFYGFLLDYESMQDLQEAELIDKSHVDVYKKKFPDCNDKILVVSKQIAAFSCEGGVEAGDILWSIDGQLIGPHLQGFDTIIQKNGSSKLKTVILRGGKERTVEISPQELDSSRKLRLLCFDGATFFELTNEIKTSSGMSTKGVFITNSEPGSPFMAVTSPRSYHGEGVFCITKIDKKEIKALEDVIDVIPSLYQKRVFTVSFKKVSGDKKDTHVIAKHFPEFSEARFYTFDNKTKAWVVREIPNPQQGKAM